MGNKLIFCKKTFILGFALFISSSNIHADVLKRPQNSFFPRCLQSFKAVLLNTFKKRIDMPIVSDKNSPYEGRKFYIFDLDGNIINTKKYQTVYQLKRGADLEGLKQKYGLSGNALYVYLLKSKKPGSELLTAYYMDSKEFDNESKNFGKTGPYKDFFAVYDLEVGTLEFGTDTPNIKRTTLEKIFYSHQGIFEEDVLRTIREDKHTWQGPSWTTFKRAVEEGRSVSILTARGHAPESILNGIKQFYNLGYLDRDPYLTNIFPTFSLKNYRYLRSLMDSDTAKGAKTEIYKSYALKEMIEGIFEKFGFNPYHSFEVSDDEPANIEYMSRVLLELKKKYPKNRFFIVDVSTGKEIKKEINLDDKL